MSAHPQSCYVGSGSTVCNPESADHQCSTVSLPAVLRVIEQIQLAYGQCFAAFDRHARPDLRYAAEISRGIFAAMETLSERVRALPSGDPSELVHLRDSMHRELRAADARRREAEFRLFEPTEFYRADHWLSELCASRALCDSLSGLLSCFPGSAGGQPGPREEGAQPMGTPPVTVAPPNPPPAPDSPEWGPWVESIPSAGLQKLCDSLLEELDTRGLFWRWEGM